MNNLIYPGLGLVRGRDREILSFFKDSPLMREDAAAPGHVPPPARMARCAMSTAPVIAGALAAARSTHRHLGRAFILLTT